ncbi:kinesin related protein 2 [Metarhizium rileyi]|uniref:Kinesin motor protein cin8 n=1 Tax=Metarhizium rileyi (strain RCEF 4871) TaxID=1649241 RepID=A0A162JNZ4_METRR|nr:kinesin related protein 2 [Metarhizium rileyi RCEF 4871]TWU75243.1 kinesin motor protein cin8 [Metarhizium rileyi]
MGASIRAGAGHRSGITRPPAGRSSTLRQPSSLSTARGIPDRSGAVSPADSVSTATTGTKRKERDFESDAGASTGEETNINVVVRCRGRSQREVKENSAVVVQADGLKGNAIGLLLGPNSLSNKSYAFDRVYSAAADQNLVFDDTVRPILDEMLAGYNCTIFAYGQTGTGKTYTMSGDMTETLGILSDQAGIIPRVLHQLFTKLEIDDREHCVKCSYIELYNEELRDLLSIDESAKLKIYDDASRKGHATTIVQGMEEKHIKNASEGIKVLQDGSLKRQVAATKCNDLSSRSHTVFTITAYVKKTNDQGVDDFVSAGKLNLVDLAGSENIQRSGAENKRAAEAGLINKSLLTLGRVINALVDRNSHIPYRESKLTRLLQDSLGGRTKTCIIATISPAKANLEETISTLDYAFRAKNIKNKPQVNPMLNKKILLNEFANEIEKLKSELISTRQRNGVYLSNDAYEDLTAQSETRRIVLEEQSARIETLETNLKNKVHELLSMNTFITGLKKDHDGLKAQLDNTKGVLDQTEIVLSATRRTLAEESQIRRAHEQTEEKLTEIGGQLINKLHKTVNDVTGLRAKNKRKSDLQVLNRAAWGTSQAQVADVTSMVERRVLEFQEEQQEHISSVSQRMTAFVEEELQKLSSTQAFLDEHLNVFADSKKLLLESKHRSKEEMDDVLDEIKVVRDTVKEKVGQRLQVMSQAAEKISGDVLQEMTNFHAQLHNSYSSLGKDFKFIFEDLVKHITAQRSEADSLRRQLQTATNTISLQNTGLSTRVEEALEEERRQTAEDRQKLMTQITGLINSQADAQEARLADRASLIQKSVTESNTLMEAAMSQYTQGMESWDSKENDLMEEVKKSREQLKIKLKEDWTAASDQSTSIQNMAKTIHAETARVAEEQTNDLDTQMEALDDFVSRAKTENASHHEAHGQSLQSLSNTVEQSFGNISAHVKTTFERVKNLGEGMELDTNDLRDGLEPLETQLCQPLINLREGITSTALQEYQPTGDTPQKATYLYPTKLPRTEPHDVLISKIDEEPWSRAAGDLSTDKDDSSLFPDMGHRSSPIAATRQSNAGPADRNMSLREVNPNVTANLTGALTLDPRASTMSMPPEHTMSSLKKPIRGARSGRNQSVMEGRENIMVGLEQGLCRRKSPRLK